MVEIKEMPYSEKYAIVLDNIRSYDTTILPFIKNHIGEQAVGELRNIWQEGIKSISDDATDEEKYETAYSNWIWMAKSNYSFVRDRMGKDGIGKYKEASARAIKQNDSDSAKLPFKTIAEQMDYQMQWITPASLSKLTENKAVFFMPRCKILDFPDTEDVCLIGCQEMFPIMMKEQLGVDMKFDREGNSCTCTITPLS